MLPLSANSDFKNVDNFSISNPYYDLNAELIKTKKIEVYGTDAIDQAIENVLCTEPLERLFNPNFWSPLYTILFENMVNMEEKINSVFDAIERWVPIRIDREDSKIETIPTNNCVLFQIPYFYVINGQTRTHVFKRIIGR